MASISVTRPASAAATLIGLVAIVLWASLAALTTASGAMPPFELAALTFAIGGGTALLITALRGRLGSLRQPWRVWALGVGGLFGYHAFYFAALRCAPPAQASLVAYLWPLLIVLMSAALPGERLRLAHVLGASLGLSGVMVLTTGRGGGFVPEPRFLPGYGLALGAAFVWSSYSVLSRRFSQVPTETVAGFCVATALLAALVHILTERTVLPETPNQALSILALGLGPVGLAFFVWDYGVKAGDIRLLGVLSYAAPVLSTVLMVALGFTEASGSLAAACLLIVAGAGIAALKPRARKTAA